MTFSPKNIVLKGPLEPRKERGITFIGPDFFAKDKNGDLLSPIASVFPKYRAIVHVRGIHACHTSLMLELLKPGSHPEDLSGIDERELELDIYDDAVSLLLRGSLILVRSDPAHMEHVFAADQILQSFYPKEQIQFTGLNIPEVKRQLRQRGESWRVSPTPRSAHEISSYLRASQGRVGTGLTLYYSASSGDRFLTYDEFMHIRPLLRQNRREAVARLREIVNLRQRMHNWGSRELSLFLPAGAKLDFKGLGEAVSARRPSCRSRVPRKLKSV